MRFAAAAATALVAALGAEPGAALDLNPFSAIKGAVEALAEDRSAGDIAKDLEIKARITAEVIEQLGSEAISINADVYEQDVMLTGAVESAGQKATAGRLSAAIADVKTLYNEILVVRDIDQKKGAVETFVDGHGHRDQDQRAPAGRIGRPRHQLPLARRGRARLPLRPGAVGGRAGQGGAHRQEHRGRGLGDQPRQGAAQGVTPGGAGPEAPLALCSRRAHP